MDVGDAASTAGEAGDTAGETVVTDRRPSDLRTRIEHEFDRRSAGLAAWLYRRTHGRIARLWRRPVLLLTTTGRRSGRRRTVPVQYFPDGDAMVVVAANSGMPSHPTWYLNLGADPRCRVEVDDRVVDVEAAELSAAAAEAFWPTILEQAPDYARFPERTVRRIPLVRLVATPPRSARPTMEAVTYERYGGPEVLELRQVERPEPGRHQVLIQVRGSSVNPYDWHFMTGLPLVMRLQLGGLRHPKHRRLGIDVAGVVTAVGSDVSRFAPGDEVFGMVDGGEPGAGDLAMGALAEYVCVSERWLETKPAALSFEEAGVVPAAAITAYQGLRHIAGVRPGQRVLVNGASGGVGTFAVQIAKAAGAEVTGVCSTANVETVRSLGADHVVDYTCDDFADRPYRYDVILDNVGNRSLSDMRRVLLPDGIYLASFGQPEHRVLGPFAFLVRMAVTARASGERLRSLDQQRDESDLAALVELIEDGRLRPVIDRTYPLRDTAAAMAHLATGHARAKVAVSV